MTGGASVCAAHLVRRANGVAPLARFLDSCDRHPAGIDHELVLILKGFDGRLDDDHARVLDGRVYRAIHVGDAGFDLMPYLATARAVPHDYVCFLNSFSVVLAAGWLAKLCRAAADPTVGLAGASGAMNTSLDYQRERWRAARAHGAGLRGRAWTRYVLRDLSRAWVKTALYAAWFPRSPSPHVRTNAFVMRRELMLQTWGRLRVPSKLAAWRFEHGRDSLTRRVARLGLRTVVVGRDGRAYDPPEWDQSDTFALGDQGNLLVADNQTDCYTRDTPQGRAATRRRMWQPTAV